MSIGYLCLALRGRPAYHAARCRTLRSLLIRLGGASAIVVIVTCSRALSASESSSI